MLETVIVSLALHGHESVGWPLLTVKFNQEILHDGPVVDRMLIRHTLPVLKHNSLVIEHHSKNADSVTYDHAGHMIDRWCQIEYIGINDLRFDVNFFSYHQIWYEADDGEKLLTDYLGKNGRLTLDFEFPLWRFWGACNKVD